MGPVTIFKTVNNQVHKRFLLETLVAIEGEILLKGDEDESEHVSAVSINDQNQIQCVMTDGSKFKFGLKSVLTCYFRVNNEKYMFEATAVPFEGGLNLSVTDLFHLQRRKNFRYTLPSGFQADCLIATLNLQQSNTTCRLIDVSTEGCAVLLTAEMPTLRLDDRVEAVMFLQDREPIPVQGFVKNLRVHGDDMVIGLEFNHLANSSEFAIISAIVEMQRSAFRKAA
ncbi:PilZ domain-containing protein [Bdellovibrio sp. HCB290]|uniref:PilZ domain-containing protein n=1 Tax=Bdellovibrio sp. HCB290 TaxID=3394356 RepID=UPI0039B5F6A9